MTDRPPLALIAGPTASGKSALAIELAERTGGTIVNADASQVYRDLPILSAAPSPAERARVPHRLFGYVDAADACSAARWSDDAKAAISEIHAAGGLPILVGGSGLYIRTLLDGIAPIPEIEPSVRQAVRALPQSEARAALADEDPQAAARLHPADTARTTRALEVVRSTGRTLAQWQAERTGGIGGAVSLAPLIVTPDRGMLYARCDRRFEAMVGAGAIEEVRELLARRLDAALPAMRAIGVRELGDLLGGRCDHVSAIAAGQRATRHYAKRQFTWFAHQAPADWPRLDPKDERSGRGSAIKLLASSLTRSFVSL